METRIIVAYALCAIMALVLAFVVARHLRTKRQFKIRQTGRGKNPAVIDETPSK